MQHTLLQIQSLLYSSSTVTPQETHVQTSTFLQHRLGLVPTFCSQFSGQYRKRNRLLNLRICWARLQMQLSSMSFSSSILKDFCWSGLRNILVLTLRIRKFSEMLFSCNNCFHFASRRSRLIVLLLIAFDYSYYYYWPHCYWPHRLLILLASLRSSYFEFFTRISMALSKNHYEQKSQNCAY